MRIRFSWLFVCIFCLMLSQISLQSLVKKTDSPKIGARGQTGEKSSISTWKKGETPKTERKGSEIGTHRKSSDKSGKEVTDGDEEGDDEGVIEKGKTDKKKTSKAKKVGKVIKEVTENPVFNKLLDFGLDQAKDAIKDEKDRKAAEAQSKAEEAKRKADLEYERQRLAIQREDEMERLKIEKARQDLELLAQKKAAAKKRLEEARMQAGEQEELTGESAEEFVPSEEEARIEAAVPELSGYPKVLKEEFAEVLINPGFVQNVDQFVNNLKIFVYINIGGEPELEDPQELKDAYSATQEFLDKLVKAIKDGKIKILTPKLSEIKELKVKMSKIELADFLNEAKKIIANHNSNKFPIENQTLFLRGIAEWAYYATSLKKAEKLKPTDETQFIEILKSIPFGKEVTAEAIKQLQEVKKSRN